MAKRTSVEEIEKLDKLIPKTKGKLELEPALKPTRTIGSANEQSKIDPMLLRRTKPKKEYEKPKQEPKPLTEGNVGKIIDVVATPSRESIRSFTYIDRIQAKLLPQLDVIDLVWQNM